MKSIFKLLRVLPLFLLLAACSTSYPDGLVLELKNSGIPNSYFKYYSPSIVQAATAMDTTQQLAKLADGIYDIMQFEAKPGNDSTYRVSPDSLFTMVDQLESEGFEYLLPKIDAAQRRVRLMGKTVNDDLRIVLLLYAEDPSTATLTEIRGENLRDNLTKAMMSGMMNGGFNIPFLK